MKFRTRHALFNLFSCLLIFVFTRQPDILARALSVSTRVKSLEKTIDGVFNENQNNNSAKKSTSVSQSENRPCHFNKTTRELQCNGSFDYDYFQLLRHEPIQNLILDNYIGELFSSSSLKNPQSEKSKKPKKCYLQYPEAYEKITGHLQLKNTGLRINFILSMTTLKDRYYEYTMTGAAFSTKFVKISVDLEGNLNFKLFRNNYIVSIAIKTKDSIGSPWILQSNLTLVEENKNLERNSEDWVARGFVKSDYISENDTSHFVGVVKTMLVNEECQFSGEITLRNGNLLWNVGGKVSTKSNKGITIHKGAFSGMLVKNILFRNSNFFNDFDQDAFEGLKGVETISFLSSRLEVMPKLNELFKNLEDLKELHIEDCTTPQLRFGVGSKSPLKNLKKVSFKDTGPLEFHEYSFLWLENANVTYLNLRNSYVVLSQYKRPVLKGVSHSLKYLDLSYSHLKCEDDLTVMLRDLKLVNLTAEGLELKTIPTVALSALKYTLRYLSLRGNNFEKALGKNIFNSIFDFPIMIKLMELDLRDCHINYLERGAFDSLPNLKILHLANNNFENLQDGWLLTWPRVTHLDLSMNRRSKQILYVGNTVNASLSLNLFHKLQVLNLTDGVFENPKKVINNLGSSLRQLFLRNTNLENLPVGIFDKMGKLEVLDLSSNENLNSKHTFSMNLFRNLKKLKVLNLKGCRIDTASMYRGPINKTVELRLPDDSKVGSLTSLDRLEVLDLSSNNIKKIEYAMFNIFPSLKILKLCANGITTWKEGTFNFSSNLETVYLNENKIEGVTVSMMTDLMKLRFFKLGNNPFICGPYVYDFVEIIKARHEFDEYQTQDFNLINITKNTNTAAILDWSENNYVCFSSSKSQFVPFISVEEAFVENVPDPNLTTATHRNAYLWVLLAVVCGAVFTIGIFCWKVLDIHLITKVIRNAVALSFLSHKSKEPDKYDFNVFVSYSDKDRQWVIDELMPRLQLVNDIRVCLHERDFQVGLSILENIIASIDNSRNIMLVLSTAFLKSHWCQYEMHLAQHRLLEKGRDQLILILLEDIPVIKRPRSLRYLMMTKTYLEWPAKPKNRNEIELFWSRLLKALKI